jgi:hypothetical protein
VTCGITACAVCNDCRGDLRNEFFSLGIDKFDRCGRFGGFGRLRSVERVDRNCARIVTNLG